MRNAFFGLLLALLVGCATAPQAPPASLPGKVAALLGDGAQLMWIPSQGPIADQTFMALSSTGPSKMSKDLAQYLSRAHDTEVRVAVSGSNSSKARQVAVDALALAHGPLPKLRLAFIGAEADGELVRKAVEAQSGQFLFDSYP